MSSRVLAALLASLALTAGCEFGKKTTWEGPIAQCRSAGAACTGNEECCSYGCISGICTPGNHDGAVCRTTDDCGVPDFSFAQMLCKSGHCSSSATCRDPGDVCDLASQCCSHHCSGPGGSCVPNRPPALQMGSAVQAVPRNQPWTVVNTSFDPDAGDTLAYGWTLTRLPPGSPMPGDASLSSASARNPVFTPGTTITAYLLALDVTDNWGLTTSSTVVLDVVNAAPTVTPATPAATVARNGALTVSMQGSDANGDTLSCTWSVCRAGTATCLAAPAAPGPVSALPTSPQTMTATFPTGLVATAEGAWEVALTCSDGALSTTGATTVTVTNSPPAVNAPATRTYNLAFTAGATPQKNVAATAVDANGDTPLSWTWVVLASSLPLTLVNANTDTVGFTPTAAGTYALRATACDAPVSSTYATRPGDCGSADVIVTVYPYIRPISSAPGAIVDAAWRKVGGNERLVAVGTDSGAANQLWIVNPAVDPGTTADATVALGAAPAALSLSSDGLTALVGEAAGHWQTVAVGSSPAAGTLQTAPLTVTSVVHFGASTGYLLGSGGASAIYGVNLGTGAATAMTCKNAPCSIAGIRATGNGTTLWALDPAGPTVRAFSELGNQLNQDAAQSAPAAATGIWRSSDPNYLFMDGASGIVFSSTLGSTGASLPSGTTHADSSLSGGALVGLAATGATMTPFGSSFTAGTPIALPRWGLVGADRTVSALRVFVSSDGSRAHVVVRAGGTADVGLYSCTLPCPLF